jgi:hypothetical protein
MGASSSPTRLVGLSGFCERNPAISQRWIPKSSRSAVADDTRRADHFLDRQRRSEIFRHYPGDVPCLLPQLSALNIMNLSTPQRAILSAIIFNALIIIALIPLALKGVAYRPIGAGPLLRSNLLIYGGGGVIVPFIGIKAIDLAVTALRLA